MKRERHKQGKTPLTPTRREEKYYGVAACHALWKARAQDIIRVYIHQDLLSEFGPLLKWAAQHRKAYHIVSEEDLERLTRAEHHQGICLLALEREVWSFDTWRKSPAAQSPTNPLLVYLDGVENPHNLGAIVRTCAHFGVSAILGEHLRLPRMSASACRVAEGGAEYVTMVTLERPSHQLGELRNAGYQLCAVHAAPGAKSVYTHGFTARSVLMLGAEQTGISSAIQRVADLSIQIPGSGLVESLNVSVAAAIIISEYHRQHG
ncbi:MAG: tRNA/rRNA methyltransferase [Gammaproteobacteria bacterium]|nr:tRNA/rRNA methyltransferase [Gammaproteobacteria bacterium]